MNGLHGPTEKIRLTLASRRVVDREVPVTVEASVAALTADELLAVTLSGHLTLLLVGRLVAQAVVDGTVGLAVAGCNRVTQYLFGPEMTLTRSASSRNSRLQTSGCVMSRLGSW